MQLTSDSFFYNALGVFTALIVICFAFIKWKLSFWRRCNLPTAQTSAVNVLLQKESLTEYNTKIYKEAKDRNLKHIGTYFLLRPTYVPVNPEIIKYILIKDFNNFMDRGVYFNEDADPLSGHLFSIEGEKWKALRQKLSPTFSSGQMKIMFPTLADCGEQLREHLKKNVHTWDAIDIKEVLARLTTDIIGSCAFGIQCNTLENPDAEFREYGRRLFAPSFVDFGKFLIGFSLPRKLLHKIGFAQTRGDVTNFFKKVVEETVNYRESNNVYRKDFMQLLLQLKNRSVKGEIEYINGKVPKLTMNEIAAQAFVFYAAGFETSSTAMTFAIYEMALNQTIQEKAREEINTILTKYDDKITYEGVVEMTYLQKVLDGKKHIVYLDNYKLCNVLSL